MSFFRRSSTGQTVLEHQPDQSPTLQSMSVDVRKDDLVALWEKMSSSPSQSPVSASRSSEKRGGGRRHRAGSGGSQEAILVSMYGESSASSQPPCSSRRRGSGTRPRGLASKLRQQGTSSRGKSGDISPKERPRGRSMGKVMGMVVREPRRRQSPSTHLLGVQKIERFSPSWQAATDKWVGIMGGVKTTSADESGGPPAPQGDSGMRRLRAFRTAAPSTNPRPASASPRITRSDSLAVAPGTGGRTPLKVQLKPRGRPPPPGCPPTPPPPPLVSSSPSSSPAPSSPSPSSPPSSPQSSPPSPPPSPPSPLSPPGKKRQGSGLVTVSVDDGDHPAHRRCKTPPSPASMPMPREASGHTQKIQDHGADGLAATDLQVADDKSHAGGPKDDVTATSPSSITVSLGDSGPCEAAIASSTTVASPILETPGAAVPPVAPPCIRDTVGAIDDLKEVHQLHQKLECLEQARVTRRSSAQGGGRSAIAKAPLLQSQGNSDSPVLPPCPPTQEGSVTCFEASGGARQEAAKEGGIIPTSPVPPVETTLSCYVKNFLVRAGLDAECYAEALEEAIEQTVLQPGVPPLGEDVSVSGKQGRGTVGNLAPSSLMTKLPVWVLPWVFGDSDRDMLRFCRFMYDHVDELAEPLSSDGEDDARGKQEDPRAGRGGQ